jgi:hypothetical protein
MDGPAPTLNVAGLLALPPAALKPRTIESVLEIVNPIVSAPLVFRVGIVIYTLVQRRVSTPSCVRTGELHFFLCLVMYAKCGRVDSTLRVFRQIGEEDYISWNLMLACYVKNGLYAEPIEFFFCEILKQNDFEFLLIFTKLEHTLYVIESSRRSQTPSSKVSHILGQGTSSAS